jgi:SAM-dependent methyltransferase
MGKEQPASYYDAVYKKATEYYKPWQESRYLKVWERMAQRLDPKKPIHDLGCGPGQTAGYLFSQGFESYFGVDFSNEAIQIAKKIFPDAPPTMFRCADLFEYLLRYNDGYATVYKPDEQQFFCSETLEHIQDDLGVMEILSNRFPGSKMSLSVPTFDDPGHARYFKNTAQVLERYGPHLGQAEISQIGPWIVMTGTLIQPYPIK